MLRSDLQSSLTHSRMLPCQRRTHRRLIPNKASAQAPKWVPFPRVSPDKANTQCPERPQKTACVTQPVHSAAGTLQEKVGGRQTCNQNPFQLLNTNWKAIHISSLYLHILPSISHSCYSYHISTTNNHIFFLSSPAVPLKPTTSVLYTEGTQGQIICLHNR